MSSLTSAYKTVNRYFDISLVAKFLVLFAVFYYSNMYVVRLITPGESYNQFVDQNLNYIDWITVSIMHTSNFITQSVGLNTRVADTRYFIGENGRLVMAWQCVGLGIMSFWAAFILAHKMRTLKKVTWVIAGWLVVWILNCIRTTLLMVALESNVKEWKRSWAIGKGLDHHDIFNYGCYILLLTLLYLFYKRRKNLTRKSISHRTPDASCERVLN